MKKFIFITILSFIFTNIYTQEQAQEAFKIRMNNHVANYIENEIDMTKAREIYGHTCLEHHIVHDEDVRSRAADAEKHAFIIDNMAEYKRLFFPQAQDRSSTDVFICDNGGFEDDFLHYEGFSTTFNTGSLTCTPLNGSTPSVYVPATLPTAREFEIVGTGTDAITGFQKVKFGNKSLKLNDPYNHNPTPKCSGNYGVNKIVKTFKVNEENRDFTVWYSLALENPPFHGNSSPFFSIRCDLAPFSDLCFDANILECDSIYSQPGCTNPELMDVLDWTCHRVKIPATEIGNTATLEIVMGDCGQGAHNGYAYIDGICEECTGSALGSMTISADSLEYPGIGIEYSSCDGDKARICGRYTKPFICGDWNLDSIFIPGYISSNMSIDTINQLFCIDFSIDNFISETEIEAFIGGFFKKEGGGFLPVVFSNSIVLKQILFKKLYDADFEVSQCFNNTDPEDDDNNISDDYYFVNVWQNNGTSEAWEITRKLLDPYDNESGISSLASGTGPFDLQLGPFLIQEGSWEMIVTIDNCTYIFVIDPPNYCSGCNAFRDIEISNVTCYEDNEWSFTLTVPGSEATSNKFKLFDENDLLTPILEDFYGSTQHVINELPITFECRKFRIVDISISSCFTEFTVCPPKPCDITINCDMEVVIKKIECVRQTSTSPYNVTLDVAETGFYSICYNTTNNISAGSNNTSFPVDGILGPFTGYQTIVLFLCPGGDCSLCTEPECFKVINVFQPKCDNGDYGGIRNKISATNQNLVNEKKPVLKIVPNPINNNELNIISELPKTIFDIFDAKGQRIFSDSFIGEQYTVVIPNLLNGTYILQYLDTNQNTHYITFIKI